MKTWIIMLALAGVLSVVCHLLLPSGKIEKTLRKSVGMVITVLIVMPLPALIKNGFDFSDKTFENQFAPDSDYIDFTENYYIRCIERDIEKKLTGLGISGAEIIIDYRKTDNSIEFNYVRINLQKAVIDFDKEHINKYQTVVNAVKEIILVSDEQVIIVD